jgi:hypothetical protein
MIRLHTCWFPELFLVNDFTVPGAAIKQGRRQEPCYTPNHLPRLAIALAFLPPSSFGPRFSNDTQQKSFLGYLNGRRR